jgi:signal transduction histidine kinase
MPTALMIVDDDDRVRLVNDRAAAVLGRTIDDLVAKPLDDVLGIPCLAEGGDRSEHTIVLDGDDKRTIGYSSSRVGHERIVVFQDLTRVVELRTQRDKLMRLAAIGEALPSLLHELKNPLAAIATAVEVMLEEVEQQDHQEMLHAVLSEVRRMKLGFDGISAVGRVLPSRRYAAIDYATREAARILEPRLRDHGVHFRFDVGDMPLLPLDPAVVRAIVFNFVTNALHACERGDAVTLRASLDDRGRRFELSVVDTGRGMTPDVARKATQLFFTTKTSGSGIGLALCHRAVEEAGGNLEIRSVPGVGTNIFVSVPLMRNDENHQKESRWVESRQ